ncbi:MULTISPECIES: MobC family plasmid mobilization relaxosome protein [unclassified Tolypothrix]|uniref:MobC family plasmid mobilization relaxosome protein n=1 Tax=unclassified Tolypothrix TaxID=2649714 RepID=UPI0021E08622|nr:MobC family plasmid mobilization relaxosome protein [Tolypothrix sp. PCC 7601]
METPSRCVAVMRPKLSKNLLRNKTLEARVNAIEHEMIKQKAQDAGLSIAEFTRRSVLLKPLPRRLSKITLFTYRELVRIGNNINQLTRATNAALKMGVRPPANPSQLEELRNLLQQIGRELSSIETEVTDDDDIDDEDNEEWE